MTKQVLVTVPNLSLPGGVCAFWNALLPEFSKMKNIEMTTLEIGGHGKNVFGPIKDQMKLNKKSKENFDLVVLNPSLGGRSFFRDAFFAKQLRKNKVPFAVFFHGWNLQFQEKVDKKYIPFFLRTLGSAKTIFVLSSAFEKKLLEWGYKGEIIVATTTVDSRMYEGFKYVNKSSITEERLQILFLSRLLKAKGLYETVEAFRNLTKKYPKLEMVIAGNGEEYDPLLEFTNKDTNINMVGHIEGEEKINLFKTCDVYCLPSYSEGLPTSVLEAMAFGKPVITTMVGGLKDFFKDGEMGFFVKTKSAIDLEEKLETLISNATLRKSIGDFNYNYAHSHILSSKVAEKMAHVFLKE